jgi:hypothetical protein
VIDWSNADWSYMLGVVHGDGHVAKRSIEIAVGYKDTDYAEVLTSLWEDLGFSPKVYRPRSALKIAVHSIAVAAEFRVFKSGGLWSWPDVLDARQYLAGVFDTDGSVSIPAHKAISIGLKRSGNLLGIAPLLAGIGVREVRVTEGETTFKGAKYAIETIKLSGMDRIVAFTDAITLRNPRKRERLSAMRAHVDALLSKVPLWQQVALWLQEESRTGEEIAEHFHLSVAQANSALQYIRRHMILEAIPPPRSLMKYRVKGGVF